MGRWYWTQFMSYLKENILLCCLSFLLFIARIDAGSIFRATSNQSIGEPPINWTGFWKRRSLNERSPFRRCSALCLVIGDDFRSFSLFFGGLWLLLLHESSVMQSCSLNYNLFNGFVWIQVFAVYIWAQYAWLNERSATSRQRLQGKRGSCFFVMD